MKKGLWLIGVLLPVLLYGQNSKSVELNVVFIGNSITQGALLANPAQDAPPVKTVEWLRQQPTMKRVEFSNQGISGSTTVDYLPSSHTYFPNMKKATDLLVQQNPKAILLFSMMLGTNDSANSGTNGAPVSPQQYYTNVKVIIDELLSTYPNARIVLHRPVWYSPNTYNSAMYLQKGLQRLESYYPQLQQLVEQYASKSSNQVFIGDTDAFDYLKANYLTDITPEAGNAGTFYLHPNKKGAAKLGEFWGAAIYRVMP